VFLLQRVISLAGWSPLWLGTAGRGGGGGQASGSGVLRSLGGQGGGREAGVCSP